jgi:hypothetical protein
MNAIHVMAAAWLLTFFLGSPSFAAVESEQPGTTPDMTEGAVPPKRMTIPAIPEGQSLKPAEQHGMLNKKVKNPHGEEIGTVQKLMTSKDGRIEYAEISLAESKTLVPVPWNAFKVEGDSLILNATKAQLQKEGAAFRGGESSDFEHKGEEPLKPNLRQGGG